jgi:hypothetical protein
MIPIQNKKYSKYSSDELARLENQLADYSDKSRSMESETLVDLDKHLWLANGAAATISIGFVQAADEIAFLQYWGCWSFIFGIVLLVVQKNFSTWTSSRDRFRFDEARMQFYKDERTDEVFGEVRDRKLRLLNILDRSLKKGAGLTFVAGLVLTMVGIQCTVATV